MKLLTHGEPKIEVLPALQRARPTPDPKRPELRFSGRLTRTQRYPLEPRLASLPGPSRLGRNPDMSV